MGREWLVTNGLGGYASGTVSGVLTRRYHGLLVASFAPPVERTVLVGGVVETVAYGGRQYPLSTNEYRGGAVSPEGFRHIESFELDDGVPVWVFAIADCRVEFPTGMSLMGKSFLEWRRDRLPRINRC